MTDALKPLETHKDASRIRAKVLRDGRLHLILDGEGLGREERAALETRLTDAAMALDGVNAVEIAVSAPKIHRRLVAIGSGKGGVGKSTLTANLAVALAKKGVKVGVIDADIYGPSQPTLLDAHAKPEARDKQLIPVTSPSGVKLLSVGQLVEAGTALAWRGPMATGALNQLVQGDWDDTEILLVDLPPGTGDVQLSLVQKAKPAGALVISTPQDLALIDATRAIDLFEKVGVPVLGLVENMAGYRCPHCGEESDPFGSGGAQASAQKLGVPFLGRLPLSASLREASDAGRPPAGGEGPAADAFATLADALMSQLETIER